MEQLPVFEVLPGTHVCSIATASDGTLWFGTESGLARLSGQRWTTYTTDDGLADDCIRSIALAPDGAVWIGTRHSGTSRYLPPKAGSQEAATGVEH